MRSSISIAILALCAASATFGERVELEAYASGLDTVSIAIVPFKQVGPAVSMGENAPWDVVAADMEFSPRFRVMRSVNADTAAFRTKGVPVYVDGEYNVEGAGLVIDCYVRDVGTGQVLLGRKYRGDSKQLRAIAHRFSNQLVESLFGDKGIYESRVVLVRTEVDAKDLYLMDYDGRGMRRVTNTKVINIFPTFVDSSRLLWVSFMRGKPDLYLGAIGSNAQPKAVVYSRAVQTSPSFNPVENKFAYASSKTGNLEIYVADADGSNAVQLTFRGGIDTAPCWSPTGYQLAFTSDRSGQPQIYVMDADGTNARRLTFVGGYQDSPAWSPRGDRIAYASFSAGTFNIWTIGSDGSDPRQVSTNPGSNEYPCWSPDGNHIMYMCRNGSNSDIYCVRADGTGLRRITASGDAAMPDWERM